MNLWLLFGVLALSTAQPPSEPGAGWLSNYDEARAAARQAGKPIFAVFR